MLTIKNWAMKGFSSFAGLIILLSCGCQPSGPKALLQGQKYLRDGKYEKALRSFNRAAESMPNLPQVWNHIGLAYHGLNNPRKAAQAYEQSLRLDRNLAPAHYNLGVLHFEEGRYPEAINELGAFTALQPDEPGGWKEFGKALLRAGRLDEAERALRNALKLTPKDAEIYNELALLELKQKRPREAVRALNTALQINPAYGPALLNQAVIAQEYYRDKKIALQRYKAFLATNPRTPEVPQVLRLVGELEDELRPKPKIVPPPEKIEEPERKPVQIAENHSEPTNPPPKVAVEQARPTNNPSPRVVSNENPPANPHPARTNPPVALIRTNAPPPAAVEKPATNPPPVLVARAEPRKEEPAEPLPEVEVVQLTKDPVFKPPVDVPARPVQNQARTNVAAPQPQTEEKPLFAPRKKEEPTLAQKLNPLHWFGKNDSSQAARPEPSAKTRKPELKPVRIAREITRPNLDLSTNLPIADPPKVIARYAYRKNLSFAKGNHEAAEKFFQEGAAAQAEKRYPAAIAAYKKSDHPRSAVF